mmetsp:Transcript_15689/g.53192  ORF Transcript_15689/g.53192 Transcript_15689/m.53192 type:complete len:208 (-) Transcript_15689:486-1109(-)
MAPSAGGQLMPSRLLSALASFTARRFMDSRMEARSETYSACDSSPGDGGATMSPMATCPTVLEHSCREPSFCCWNMYASSKPCSCMNPPRSPHSPMKPLEVECSVTRRSSPESCPRPMPSATLRIDTNSFPSAHTFSWYTSSAMSTSSSSAHSRTTSRRCASGSTAPVGLPGLMNTSARTLMPLRLCSARLRSSSARLRLQLSSSSR